MKVLVATKEKQGVRKNDFAYAKEGELVTLPFECDGESVDGRCGCKRAWAGVESHMATTTARVEDAKGLTPTLYAKALAEGLVNAGWYKTEAEAMEQAESDAAELARLARGWPVGAVLEKRGDKVVVR